MPPLNRIVVLLYPAPNAIITDLLETAIIEIIMKTLVNISQGQVCFSKDLLTLIHSGLLI